MRDLIETAGVFLLCALVAIFYVALLCAPIALVGWFMLKIAEVIFK